MMVLLVIIVAVIRIVSVVLSEVMLCDGETIGTSVEVAEIGDVLISVVDAIETTLEFAVLL